MAFEIKTRYRLFVLTTINFLRIINLILTTSVLILLLILLSGLLSFISNPVTAQFQTTCTNRSLLFNSNISATFCEENPDFITFKSSIEQVRLPLLIVRSIALRLVNRSSLPFEGQYSGIKVFADKVNIAGNITLYPDTYDYRGYQDFVGKLMLLGHL